MTESESTPFDPKESKYSHSILTTPYTNTFFSEDESEPAVEKG
jgi:hypothetical protein